MVTGATSTSKGLLDLSHQGVKPLIPGKREQALHYQDTLGGMDV